VLQERLANLTGDTALTQAAKVAAARPTEAWGADGTTIAARLGLCARDVRGPLLSAVEAWNRDPRKAAAARLAAVQQSATG
jgi:transcription elongation factor